MKELMRSTTSELRECSSRTSTYRAVRFSHHSQILAGACLEGDEAKLNYLVRDNYVMWEAKFALFAEDAGGEVHTKVLNWAKKNGMHCTTDDLDRMSGIHMYTGYSH
jgi:hypothetical protein